MTLGKKPEGTSEKDRIRNRLDTIYADWRVKE